LWNNDGVDVSLKDGLFIQLCSNTKNYEDDLGEVCDSDVTDANFECTDTFAGFLSPSPNGAISRDRTPSPKVHIYVPVLFYYFTKNASCTVPVYVELVTNYVFSFLP
jgi:hypothetical protein